MIALWAPFTRFPIQLATLSHWQLLRSLPYIPWESFWVSLLEIPLVNTFPPICLLLIATAAINTIRVRWFIKQGPSQPSFHDNQLPVFVGQPTAFLGKTWLDRHGDMTGKNLLSWTSDTQFPVYVGWPLRS